MNNTNQQELRHALEMFTLAQLRLHPIVISLKMPNVKLFQMTRSQLINRLLFRYQGQYDNPIIQTLLDNYSGPVPMDIDG